MQHIVIHEQIELGVGRLTAIKTIEDAISMYVVPESKDFPNIGFYNVKVRFSPVGDGMNSLLFPSKNYLKVLGYRMFLTDQ